MARGHYRIGRIFQEFLIEMISRDVISIATDFASLASQAYPIERAYLFGSYVKNEADESSDIDVCLVSSNFGKDIVDEIVDLSRIASDVDLRIEPHPMSPEDFAEKYNALAHEVKAHGVLLPLPGMP